MFRMYRDEENAVELAQQSNRGCIRGGRQQVVGLVDHDPVRPASASPQLPELRQEGVEERWSAIERDAEQVDDHALRALREHVKYFGDTGLALGISKNDRPCDLAIIAFWVDDAKLVLAVREAFEHARSQRRFAALRRADE